MTPAERVVLVHGMGRTAVSLLPLARWLRRHGYAAESWGYWSYRQGVAALAAALAVRIARAAEGAERIHFVTHSLGGILVRQALAAAPLANAGRLVMLAPPNRGSRAADRWAPYLGRVMPPIRDLRTAADALVHAVPVPPGVEIGVIAGLRDGKVSVAETGLDGAHDHAVVPCRHSLIMHRADVRELTLRFLRTGRFSELQPEE